MKIELQRFPFTRSRLAQSVSAFVIDQDLPTAANLAFHLSGVGKWV